MTRSDARADDRGVVAHRSGSAGPRLLHILERWRAALAQIPEDVRIEVLVVAASAVILGAMLVPIAGAHIENNGAVYMYEAFTLMRIGDEGFVPTEGFVRGATIPGVLAIGFLFLGKTVEAAIVASRVAMILCLVLVYVLARLAHGRVAGVVAAALATTAFGVQWVGAHLNGSIIWPLTALMFLVAYMIALRTGRRSAYGIAGASFALAVWTHEIPMLLIGVPLLVPLLARDRARHLRAHVWAAAGFAIALVPAAVYLLWRFGTVRMTGAEFAADRQFARVGFEGPLDLAAWLVGGGLAPTWEKFYQTALVEATPLAPLLVAAWVGTTIVALARRRKEDLVIATALFCQIPIVIVIGALHNHLRQAIMLHFLLFIAVAALGVTGLRWAWAAAASRLGHRSDARTASAGAAVGTLGIAFALVSVQLVVAVPDYGASTTTLWTEGNRDAYPLARNGQGGFTVTGRFTDDHRRAADWIRANTAPEDVVVADGAIWEPVEFFLGLERDFPHLGIGMHHNIAVETPVAKTNDSRILFLFAGPSFVSANPKDHWIEYIPESQLTTQLIELQADYVLTRSALAAMYLDAVPWAERTFTGEGVFVWSIDRDGIEAIGEWEVCVNPLLLNRGLPEDGWLATTHPDEYDDLLTLIADLGFDAEALAATACRI